ncbi:hypothetical protein SO802_013810 [Lithocarpus litseifolius]|uniref:Uncharacterized protein n=1 Tax=Lithocarpus litseifolius TaxID=425828 RepID=A0AAW2D9F0_9ROSI
MRLRDQKRILMAKKAIEKYNNDENYRFLYEHISDIFARLLKSDLEFLNTGQIDKISLAAKWCPSLDSSYDRSTLFCESVARKLFPYDSDAEYRGIEEAHYVYRVRERLRKQVLIPLRKALELPETYMSRRKWDRLPYDRVPAIAMKTYKKLFFKHDPWRICSHLRYLKRTVKPKFNFSRLLPHEILSLLNYAFGEEIAEYHWRRVVEDFSSKGCFHNCISIFSTAPCYNFSNFCYAFSLLTSEFCESPWKGKVAVRNASFDVDFIKIEGEDLRSKLKTLKSHDFICVRVPEILDKVINMALECNLSTDKMIKKIFFFTYSGNSTLWRWKTNESESIRKKFEMNGYVIPDIVCWNLRFCLIPTVELEDDVTFIYGCSNDIFRVFLEGDGNLDPVAIMDVELSVKVLRLIDGDVKPAMGYIYEVMDKAKEQIWKNFNDVQRRYRPILRIIETRWELQLHRPLHAAAYFLNPKFHYDPNFVGNEEVRVGLYEVIEKMCPTALERCRIDLQLEKFDKAEGLFGKEMAILTRTKKQPGPRNLNAKKKSKKKVIEVEESKEIVDVGDDEEDVQEDANDEMILQDDEDDNFIDLDYGDDFD